MSKSNTSDAPKIEQELLDLIPKLAAMPGEDEVLMADLRQAIILELAPSTAYEHSLAEQIFKLEWEAARHRRMRDALILAEIRKRSGRFIFKLIRGVSPILKTDEKIADDIGFDLVSTDPDRRKKALSTLEECEITPDEILAISYKAVANSVQTHETQIAEIEQRRRRLRDDFDKIKAAIAKPVADAVLVNKS